VAHVAPEAALGRIALDERIEVLMAVGVGRGYVAGQRVEQRRDVARALDRGVPRIAITPPPGRPMFPNSNCRIDAQRMYWEPIVCWVQPTPCTNAVVRSRPEFSTNRSQIRPNSSGGMPHTRSTIAGV